VGLNTILQYFAVAIFIYFCHRTGIVTIHVNILSFVVRICHWFFRNISPIFSVSHHEHEVWQSETEILVMYFKSCYANKSTIFEVSQDEILEPLSENIWQSESAILQKYIKHWDANISPIIWITSLPIFLGSCHEHLKSLFRTIW